MQRSMPSVLRLRTGVRIPPPPPALFSFRISSAVAPDEHKAIVEIRRVLRASAVADARRRPAFDKTTLWTCSERGSDG